MLQSRLMYSETYFPLSLKAHNKIYMQEKYRRMADFEGITLEVYFTVRRKRGNSLFQIENRKQYRCLVTAETNDLSLIQRKTNLGKLQKLLQDTWRFIECFDLQREEMLGTNLVPTEFRLWKCVLELSTLTINMNLCHITRYPFQKECCVLKTKVVS